MKITLILTAFHLSSEVDDLKTKMFSLVMF